MNINLGNLVLAVFSIGLAKMVTTFSIPFLHEIFGLTPKLESWIYLLMIWTTGYYAYALKLWLAENEILAKIWNKE